MLKLTKSDKFIQEYSCSVVRIDDVIPVPNSDFLGQTFVNNTSLIVRKDKVSKGDIMFYASNETQLNQAFLSANNLFEMNEYSLNSNAEEIDAVVKQINQLKDNVKKFKDEIKKKEKAKKKATDETLDSIQRDIDSTKTYIDNALAKIEGLKASIKPKVGFFNKYGRVKMLRLKGVPSMGYLFTLDELKKAFPSIKDNEISEDLIGTYFDTIDDTLFVKVYVPPIKENNHSGTGGGKQEKSNENRIDRLIPGEFAFHYDTNRLNDNAFKIHPNDTIAISVKLHGTSFICGNVKCNIPINLPWYKKIVNKIIKRNSIFKSLRFKDTYVGYDNIYSSRTVIRNRYSNSISTSTDVYGWFNDIISNYIPEGYTIYGEIIGYKPNSTTFIQKNYDYGAEPGQAKLMIYRINKENDGKHYEFNIKEVFDWTLNLINENEDLKDIIHPIDILYHGKASDLYKDIEANDDFGKNFVQRLAKDSEKFGMEQLEPLCNNEVPREGLVIRIDDDTTNEAFKLKCYAFLEMEGKNIDSGNVDIEMAENNNY
jgi:hypothetical protein